MNEFMITFLLPEYIDEEFMALIPKQRAVIDELMRQGVVTSYTLSLDRTKLWSTIKASSEGEIRQIISKFPLIDYMTYEIEPIAFRNTLAFMMHKPSLN